MTRLGLDSPEWLGISPTDRWLPVPNEKKTDILVKHYTFETNNKHFVKKNILHFRNTVF